MRKLTRTDNSLRKMRSANALFLMLLSFTSTMHGMDLSVLAGAAPLVIFSETAGESPAAVREKLTRAQQDLYEATSDYNSKFGRVERLRALLTQRLSDEVSISEQYTSLLNIYNRNPFEELAAFLEAMDQFLRTIRSDLHIAENAADRASWILSTADSHRLAASQLLVEAERLLNTGDANGALAAINSATPIILQTKEVLLVGTSNIPLRTESIITTLSECIERATLNIENARRKISRFLADTEPNPE